MVEKLIKEVKTVLVDFDGTLNVFSWPDQLSPPRPGAVRFMRELVRRGYTVFIFTSRAWPGWVKVAGREFYDDQYRQMVNWLKRYEIPYHGITYLKKPSLLIVDDRSVNPHEVSWTEIVRRLESNNYGKTGLGRPYEIEEE